MPERPTCQSGQTIESLADTTISLMFHNETSKTGKQSEIVRLGPNFEIAEEISTSAGNAHNVAMLEGKLLFCDSLASNLVFGNEVVYKSQFFTRGLSVTNDFVLVGQSQYGRRELRDGLAGSVAVLDRQFRPLQIIPMPGMIQDVRAVNSFDFAMSHSMEMVAAAVAKGDGAVLPAIAMERQVGSRGSLRGYPLTGNRQCVDRQEARYEARPATSPVGPFFRRAQSFNVH